MYLTSYNYLLNTLKNYFSTFLYFSILNIKEYYTLIYDATNYILKFDSSIIHGNTYIDLYFDLDVKYLGSSIGVNYWKLEYEIKK